MNNLFSRFFAILNLGSRPAWLLVLLPGLLFAADRVQHYRVSLQSQDRGTTLKIGELNVVHNANEASYSVSMNESRFGDYFLSMRPFKCMTDKINMLCHLAYPYPIERRFSADNLAALEHDFLFIRRKPSEYGINPWNGLYYRLEKKGTMYLGQAHEVDLNILAVPPEDDRLPLLDAEIHEVDGRQLWLPRLLIEPQ